jgi:uncharacterized membrane protein (UPF0127 family)
MCRFLLPQALRLVVLLLIWSVAPLRAAELQSLAIITKTRTYDFLVEVALTEADQARGLMFRRELSMGTGMLFGFVRDREAGFWMKNTYVSLDLIFIRADGRILRIAANAKPLSERLIPSRGPVRGVLEVLAGTAARLNIAPGDRVVHPLFRAR